MEIFVTIGPLQTEAENLLIILLFGRNFDMNFRTFKERVPVLSILYLL